MHRRISDSNSGDSGGSGGAGDTFAAFYLQFSNSIEMADCLFSLICGILFIFIFENIF